MLKKILSVKTLLLFVFLGLALGIIGAIVEGNLVSFLGAICGVIYCILSLLRLIVYKK